MNLVWLDTTDLILIIFDMTYLVSDTITKQLAQMYYYFHYL